MFSYAWTLPVGEDSSICEQTQVLQRLLSTLQSAQSCVITSFTPPPSPQGAGTPVNAVTRRPPEAWPVVAVGPLWLVQMTVLLKESSPWLGLPCRSLTASKHSPHDRAHWTVTYGIKAPGTSYSDKKSLGVLYILHKSLGVLYILILCLIVIGDAGTWFLSSWRKYFKQETKCSEVSKNVLAAAKIYLGQWNKERHRSDRRA